jgi:hypothetical protein
MTASYHVDRGTRGLLSVGEARMPMSPICPRHGARGLGGGRVRRHDALRPAIRPWARAVRHGYRRYRVPDLDVRYWRTASGLEVDLVLGDMQAAVEVKGSARVHDGDLRGLRALAEEHRVRHRIVACLEREPRTVGGIQVLPCEDVPRTALRRGDRALSVLDRGAEIGTASMRTPSNLIRSDRLAFPKCFQNSC